MKPALIMSLVTIVAAAGIPAAFRAYYSITDSANAQVTLSTALTVLRSELGTASQVTVDTDSGTITYRSSSNGSLNRICLSDDGILLREYVGTSYETERSLVSSETASKTMTVLYDASGLAYEDGLLTIRNIAVKKDTSTLASVEQYTIRTAEK